MSANNPLGGSTGTPTEPEDEPALPSGGEEDDTTTSVMKELERTLEELDSGIKETVGDIGEVARQQEKMKMEEEPPHFTIGTSPTRHVHKKPEDH